MNFSSSSSVDVTLSLTLSSTTSRSSEERGVKLIQLLLNCAKHVSSGNLHHGDACLSRILQLASINGDSMQRLATWFASSLAIRLLKRWPGLYKALNHPPPVANTIVDLDQSNGIIFAKAFPYLDFAHAVINRVLIQGMSEERMIHIIDLGSRNPILWVTNFLKNIANSPNGPPHLTITCVNNNKSMLEEMSMRIKKEAKALDIPFQFYPVNVSLRDLSIDMLNVKSGESLAFVSILNLHILLVEDDRVNSHFELNKNTNNVKDSKRMSEFLGMLHSFSPKLLILVEQEANHNLNKLVDRFVEGLHYYSALFDSIDTTFGRSNSLYEERILVEQMLGKEIENMVACEGLEREERHERFGKWIVRLTRGGFRPVRLWYDIMEDAKRLVEGYGVDGYKIISQRGSLMICWHDRPIYSVSAWNCFI